jgi:hypothetical protein
MRRSISSDQPNTAGLRQRRLEDGDVVLCNHPYEGNLPHASTSRSWRRYFTRTSWSPSPAASRWRYRRRPGQHLRSSDRDVPGRQLLPPVKLYSAGRRDDDSPADRANSRQPRLLLGDLDGQVGVLQLARERVADSARALASVSQPRSRARSRPRPQLAMLSLVFRRDARGRGFSRQRRCRSRPMVRLRCGRPCSAAS